MKHEYADYTTTSAAMSPEIAECIARPRSLTWHTTAAARAAGMRLLQMMVRCIAVCVLALGTPHVADAAEGMVVIAEPQGSAVSVNVRATISAPHELIWQTLTDYAHLADFVPGMQSSVVTERRGPTAIVEQRGEAGFLIFSYGIDVVVASTEHHPETIEIRVLKGNLKRLDGRYQVERGAKAGTWNVSWVGLIEPALSLPQFLSVRLIRGILVDQFRGMVNEIERRDALRRTALNANR